MNDEICSNASKPSSVNTEEPKPQRTTSRRNSIRISRTNDNSHLLKDILSPPIEDEK